VSYQGKTATFQVTVTASGVTLISISAAFNQGSAVIYDSDSLDTLKQYLTVTATYSDSSTAVVPSTDYTLSGTLVADTTSTITVIYQGKSATFGVAVTEKPPVPVQYKQIEFISRPQWADASAFIDTGVSLSKIGTAVFEVEFMPTDAGYGSSGENHYIFGMLPNTGNYAVGFGAALDYYCNKVFDFSGGSTADIALDSHGLNQKISVQATVNSSGWTISDGENTSSVSATPRDYSNKPICLFGVNETASTAKYLFAGRIYYFKVTENNEVKMELVPCIRISDDAVGFYDKVNDAFYTATGLVAGDTDGKTDTGANIEVEGYVLEYKVNDGLVNTEKDYGGITYEYQMQTPTTALALSGILPNSAVAPALAASVGCIAAFDANGNYVNHVNSGGRWAQTPSASMSEYSQSWTVGEFSKIKFSVDRRNLDYAYMYHSVTGQVFFAGVHTPYYGMSNISEAGGN
jgi:hypothetical protein